jgi:hypothetical protein
VATCKEAAKEQNVEIVRGPMKPCEACAVRKAKQKNVSKISDHEPATSQVMLSIYVFAHLYS